MQFSKILTNNDMIYINQLLIDSSAKKRLNNPCFKTSWSVPLEALSSDTNPLIKSNNFLNTLFSSYRLEKLSVYKKIFDYSYDNKIDLISIFKELRVTNTKSQYKLYPEYLDLINYAYKKNYFQLNHDFSTYFCSFDKPTKTNINARVILLEAFSNDFTEKSFNLHCSVFKDYLKISPSISYSEQEAIKKMFLKFDKQNFYLSRSNEHKIFYPSLLNIDRLSEVQEDSFLSKRFCFTAQHTITTLQTKLQDSLNYIYNNVFTQLKEKNIIQDYYTLLEQGSFYLYVFTNDSVKLESIGRTVKFFHQEIQPFLQNNTESDLYYFKLFDTFLLTDKLSFNKLDIPKNNIKNNKI